MKPRSEFETLFRELNGQSRWRGSLLLALIFLFFVVFFFWAATTEIDNVTRGDGRIVPSSNVQIIQTAETGVLEGLHVREGVLVDEGDLLMELDRTMLSSQFNEEQQRAFAIAARVERLQAEVNGEEQLLFSDEVLRASPAILAVEYDLFTARRSELRAEIQVLERQRIQRLQELEEGRISLSVAQETRELVDREFALIEPLVERRIEPETTMLALYRTRAESDAAIATAASAIVRFEAALNEIDDQISTLESRFLSSAFSDLSQATAEMVEIQSRVPALAQRLTRTELRAPVRGIVNRVHLTTIGGFAQAGEPLIEIVPLDDTLLVEAYIRPSDIAFIYPGQPVRVKITAFDFSRYGGIDGVISRIGADAVSRPDRPQGEEPVFVVQIQTHSNILDADGNVVEIVPGMTAQVDILSGRRTILEYLIAPIIRVRERAFQE